VKTRRVNLVCISCRNRPGRYSAVAVVVREAEKHRRHQAVAVAVKEPEKHRSFLDLCLDRLL